jgi:hypothetical protein
VTSGDEAAISLFSEHSQLPPVVVELRDSEKSSERIITPFTDSTGYGSAASAVLMALAIASFLGVGYVFLDAGTHGQFTWSLRVAAAVAFAGVWVAMSSLR